MPLERCPATRQPSRLRRRGENRLLGTARAIRLRMTIIELAVIAIFVTAGLIGSTMASAHSPILAVIGSPRWSAVALPVNTALGPAQPPDLARTA